MIAGPKGLWYSWICVQGKCNYLYLDQRLGLSASALGPLSVEAYHYHKSSSSCKQLVPVFLLTTIIRNWPPHAQNTKTVTLKYPN
ncbi:hypothetical protein L6164_004217 [Bauhinia variegata]|uniref:Uncharacterized protein n=1 Tax=Bauhinia variegata TaxID=167791 RepID=A0ACB9Q5X8_BAUVA|nr:hypothetical protein L6164_004217 [Bauhinia variegata]